MLSAATRTHRGDLTGGYPLHCLAPYYHALTMHERPTPTSDRSRLAPSRVRGLEARGRVHAVSTFRADGAGRPRAPAQHCAAPMCANLLHAGTFQLSLCRSRFFTAAVWCVPALRVPLVHSLINHFRQNAKTIEVTSDSVSDPSQRVLRCLSSARQSTTIVHR